MVHRLLRFNDVSDRVKLKRTAIYGKIAAGSFPAPVKIGEASRWLDDEIQEWIEERAAMRAPASHSNGVSASEAAQSTP